MTFRSLFQLPDINQEYLAFQNTPGAALIDVRTAQEYQEGHLPGSRNIPLLSLDQAQASIEDRDTPIYLYCYSGSRSRQAEHILRRMGYQQITNMGGIGAYSGTVEH